MVSKQSRSEMRVKKHNRLRNRFAGTAERPRLGVFRSNNHLMYAQIIDDTVGNTLVAASTTRNPQRQSWNTYNDVAAAYAWNLIAKRALEKALKLLFLIERDHLSGQDSALQTQLVKLV